MCIGIILVHSKLLYSVHVVYKLGIFRKIFGREYGRKVYFKILIQKYNKINKKIKWISDQCFFFMHFCTCHVCQLSWVWALYPSLPVHVLHVNCLELVFCQVSRFLQDSPFKYIVELSQLKELPGENTFYSFHICFKNVSPFQAINQLNYYRDNIFR